jgi:signal transduction histidine kinase
MLAEFLSEHREIVRNAETRASAVEGPSVPPTVRSARLASMYEDLIASLRHGRVEDEARAVSTLVEATVELEERELVRECLLEQVDKLHIEIPPTELLVVDDWVWAKQCAQLIEDRQAQRVLLDNVAEGTVVMSPDGRIAYVNRRAARFLHDLTGVAVDDIVGKTGIELGSRDLSIARRPDELVALARSGASEERLVAGRWQEQRFCAIYGADGTIERIGLTSTDIHERKLDQVRLELLSKLSSLVGSVPYEEVAEALAHVAIPELADWCVVNVIDHGTVWRTFVAQRDPAKSPLRDALVRAAPTWRRHPLWQEMLTSGFQLLTEVSDDVVRMLAGHDDAQYALLTQVGIRSLMVVPVVARGRLVAIMNLVHTTESPRRYGRDAIALAEEVALHAAHIVENARLLKELRATEARFRVALAGARTAIFEEDESLRYVWHCSPQIAYSVVGKTDQEVFPPEEAAALTAIKARVLATCEPWYGEVQLTLGGTSRWYREAVEPVRDRLGRCVGVIGAATDVTDEKRTREELKNALEVRDLVMGVLAHDLRNPLNAVAMSAEMIVRSGDMPQTATAAGAVIQRAARRMTEMIEALLTFTRTRFTGKPFVLARVPADLRVVARDVVDELRAAWPDRAIELESTGDANGAWDATRIAEAISNLVTNGLSYGDPAAPVRVAIDGEPQDVVVRVHNEGAPIPESLVPVLFEPFRRAEAGQASPQGLGLGLYVVDQIAKAHGGSIVVESTAKDGTTFTIRLSRQEGASQT